MIEFQNIRSRPLPREARGYRDADAADFFRDATDLIIAVRIARVAWEAGPAGLGEWHAFGKALRSALRAGTSLPVLTADAASWAAVWWQRGTCPQTMNENKLGAGVAVTSSRLHIGWMNNDARPDSNMRKEI